MENKLQRYGFYPGCTYPGTAGYVESVNALNHRLGIELVEIEDWNCCGATAVVSLNMEDFVGLIGRILALANRQKVSEIVTVCNACYTSLRKGLKILSDHPEQIDAINKILSSEQLRIEKILPVRHYLEVLHDDISETVWKATLRKDFSSVHVASYYGCQFSRPWGDIDHTQHPEMLDSFLRKIGFTPVDHSAKTLCCGASHGVQYQKECRELVMRIVSEACRKGAEWITTLCPLCQLNLDALQSNQSEPIPVPYFTQLAGLAIGISEKELGMNKLLIPLTSRMRMDA